VAGIDDTPLHAALERLAEADILLVQGVPPEADYRFKHALIQDAAYENLLKSRRQVLHRRVAEMLRVAAGSAVEPELLAHHFTQAGLTEDAIEWWGKAGQRSLQRSALVEATAQFTQGLALITTLPATPALRREQIKLQVALITPLIHIKGYSAPETKAAAERARLLIEQAERLGEPPEDPLLLFDVLYGFWYANLGAFNGDVLRDLAAQYLALAEKQRATVPLMVGHRLVGSSSLHTGDFVDSRAHYDQALSLYDADEHRPWATRFGQDIRVSILSFRSITLWMLGYPEAALTDVDQVVKGAREIGHAASLIYALAATSVPLLLVGNYASVNAQTDEAVSIAGRVGEVFWKEMGATVQGYVLALTGKASEGVHQITSGIAAFRSMGATVWSPKALSYLAKAYAELGQFDDAWRCSEEAITHMETTKERWWEAEVNRVAGEIALMGPQNDSAKAEAHFERALTIARAQRTKSWELRAAMSLARLWRDQGKTQQARELLAPVYGWFTEGFDTRDLKEAKALLEELT
jgi:predicted ATPase